MSVKRDRRNAFNPETSTIIAMAGTPTPAELRQQAIKDAKKEYHRSGWKAKGYLALAMVVVLVLLYAGYVYSQPVLYGSAMAAFLGAIVLFLVAYYVPQDLTDPPARSTERLRQFLRDDEMYPSLARLQFFIWTAIVIFAFAWITFIRIFSGVPAFIGPGEITPNLLAVMGISTGSTIASAGIESYRDTKPKTKGAAPTGGAPAPAAPAPPPVAPPPAPTPPPIPPPPEGGKSPWGSMLCERAPPENLMRPSLGRFQMLGWTVISVGIYIFILSSAVYQVWVHGDPGKLTLPDLDTTLVVLMGISHVGYNTSKYVSIS
jgi:hypothetical protein